MKNNIDSLTSTRAIAAIVVVFFHFAPATGVHFIDNLIRSGNLAVSYFFVLSGYIMYVSYNNNPVSYGQFIKRRVARIVPIYWTSIFLSFLLFDKVYMYKGRDCIQSNCKAGKHNCLRPLKE